MERRRNIDRVRNRKDPWDVVVIGGGATGAGCALDAASRGFEVLLLERYDFGKGTSSRSTKLIHGGVRYLRQGNISLVREALRERSILLKNAPHVVHKQPFVIPCYSLWQKFFYGTGLKVYDRLAGGRNIEASRTLTRDETLRHLPAIKSKNLSGGVLYHDGQFDDARLLIDLLMTASSYDSVVLNYAGVTGFLEDGDGRVNGVEFEDFETGEKFAVAARAVINATGIFSDSVREMADETAKPGIAFSQGIHLVFDRKFLTGDAALMIPKTSDDRVLFCIPWHDHLLVGTTDTPVAAAVAEPQALDSEIDFILETVGEYLAAGPKREDILSVFAGIRPLVKNDSNAKTSSLSRGHDLFVDGSGLVTITGGKWTTHRRMAEDAVNEAIRVAGLEPRKSITENLAIQAPKSTGGERLHPTLLYTREDVVRAVRDEMARTVEDVLARRTRALFLDARAAIEIARPVAAVIAEMNGHSNEWVEEELRNFERTAAAYLGDPP